ncbi:MAG: hypothetical protein LBE70_02350 [Nitrososphaerota archaeon]|jgi:hypothetical protein|nr:hypothetical protein [Nitrososphaerota archaeon]
MALDPDKMKTLIAYKKRLENQLETLSIETKEVQTALDIVNTMLLEKGFKRGDLKKIPPQTNLQKEIVLPKQETREIPIDTQPIPTRTVTTTVQDRDNVFSLKTMNDESLALICFDKEAMHVMPDESKQFNAKTPPFQNFLVEKVLAKMKEKDSELVHTNQLDPDKAFTYEIIKEEDLIREIIIYNVDDERLKELKSSIRWTLEKMHEKTHN